MQLLTLLMMRPLCSRVSMISFCFTCLVEVIASPPSLKVIE
jgi:hypothetical protein